MKINFVALLCSITITSITFSTVTAQEIINQPFNDGTTLTTDWSIKAGGTYTTASGSGQLPPSIKLSTTDDFIETPDFEGATECSFWIKGYSTDSNSSLQIFALQDSSWVQIDSISPLSRSEKNYLMSLTPNTHKLRFTYYKSAGNLAFDDLVIRKVTIVDPSKPEFMQEPKITSLSNTSVSLQLKVNQPTQLQYVVFPDTATKLGSWLISSIPCSPEGLCVDAGIINFSAPLEQTFAIKGLQPGKYYSIHLFFTSALNTPDGTVEEKIIVFATKTRALGLFFSEITRGSGYNKAIELFNPTNDTVILSNYRIAMATNGTGWKTSYYTFKPNAVIYPNSPYVILKSSADSTLIDFSKANEITTSSILGFTGNDARALQMTIDGGKSWENTDIYGDPLITTDFNISGVSKAASKYNLMRKAGIYCGNINWAVSAGTDSISSEWLLVPLNDFENIGSHTAIDYKSLQFITFSINGQEFEPQTDSLLKTITITVHDTADITKLSAIFSIPEGVNVLPDPALANDYSSPISYKFAAGNLKTEWFVNVIKDKGPAITSIQYAENGTGNIVIQFNEPLFTSRIINLGDLSPNIKLTKTEKPHDFIGYNATINKSLNQVTVIPSKPLEPNTKYSISIDSLLDSYKNSTSGFVYSFISTIKNEIKPFTNQIQEFKLWPNPATDYLNINITGSTEIYQFSICSITGKSLMTMMLKANIKKTIKISSLEKGVYVLNFNNLKNSKSLLLIKN